MNTDLRDRLLAVAHAIEPLIMLTIDAEHATPPAEKVLNEGLLQIRFRLTCIQVWLFDRAKGAP